MRYGHDIRECDEGYPHLTGQKFVNSPFTKDQNLNSKNRYVSCILYFIKYIVCTCIILCSQVSVKLFKNPDLALVFVVNCIILNIFCTCIILVKFAKAFIQSFQIMIVPNEKCVFSFQINALNIEICKPQ